MVATWPTLREARGACTTSPPSLWGQGEGLLWGWEEGPDRGREINKTPLKETHVITTPTLQTGAGRGWRGCITPALACILCPVWFTVHVGPRQEALGLGHAAALCLSRGRSAMPKGEGWQPKHGLPPNISRGSTKVYSHEGLFPWRRSCFCEDGRGGLAATKLDSSVCSGSRCNEKWPPEPSWSQHC